MSRNLTATVASDLRIVIGQLRRRMREGAGPGDFTPSQIAVMLRLEHDGTATVSQLALAEGVRPQSMGATVAGLITAGVIGAEPDPADGRRTILSLTEQFRTALAAGRAAREDWLFHAIDAKLTPAEQQQLADSIALLNRLVETENRSNP